MYDRFTSLDAIGPYEVLSRLPGAQVTWLAHERGLVRTDNGMLAIEATATFEELPARFGAQPIEERVVFEGKVVTAAGVSSGIDMALALAGRIAGDEFAQAIQLLIEYDPQPPYDTGSTAKAGLELTRLVRERTADFR